MNNNDLTQPETQESQDVRRPAWTTWLLIAWIAATTALYYFNFTQTFYAANRSSIQSLLDKLF